MLRLSRRARRVRDAGPLKGDYVRAEVPKPLPPSPMRVSRQSQLRAALRQNESPIVIEGQDLAQPFVRLLRARDMKTAAARAIVAEIASYAIRRSYGSDIEAHWYIGGYVLPGNVQKVILKSKALPPCALLCNALATRPVAALLCRPANGRAPGHDPDALADRHARLARNPSSASGRQRSRDQLVAGDRRVSELTTSRSPSRLSQ